MKKIIILLVALSISGCNIKYYDKDFNIKSYKSNTDINNNGIDDVIDVINGAKEEAKKHPKYHSEYYDGGYPPDNEGVCSDVIWRSFKNAGINIKDLIDNDIKNNRSAYKRISKPDPNIDFRRVYNLKVFFSRHGTSLTLDPLDYQEWMQGDVVVFGNNHIALVSNRRNSKGISYIIHNAGQLFFEEDALVSYNKKTKISGHYRFNFKELT